MGVFLPGFSIIVVFAIVHQVSLLSSNPWGRRVSLFLSIAFSSGILVIITETLSLRNLLQKTSLIITWTIVLIGGIFIFLWLVSRAGAWTAFKNSLYPGQFELQRIDPAVGSLILIVAVQLVILAGIALKYPPNNWDSMTYHMARVAHWQQERSVAHYATNIDRQLQLQPFAEFLILHLQILSGGDHYANLVQWAAMLASGIGVSQIAKCLGARAKNQLWAMALSYSLPMGVLQSSSTQNDYVLSVWLALFVALGFAFKNAPRNTWLAMGAGLSLGLAMLTKATAYVYAFPFCFYFGISFWKQLEKKAAWNLALLCIIAFSINFGHYLRNINLYHSPLGPQTGYVNEVHTVNGFASNVIRNATLHCTIPFAAQYNQAVLIGLEKLHRITGVQSTDPRLSYVKENPFQEQPLFDEDYSGNPFHLFLILIWMTSFLRDLIMNIVSKFKKHELFNLPLEYVYGFLILFAFGLFCVYLKWQPWHSRLHLPLFVLWCPVLSLTVLNPRRKLSGYIPLILMLLSFLWITYNVNRPLIAYNGLSHQPRIDQYFAKRQDLIQEYENLTEDISVAGCHEIGLDLRCDSWEYPFWAFFFEEDYPVEIHYIDVNNPSEVLMKGNFVPCAIISEYPEKSYEKVYSRKEFDHYVLSFLDR